MKLIPLTKIQKTKVCGAGANWLVIWGMSLLTMAVMRSFFATEATVGINTVGRASWKDAKSSKTQVCEKSSDLATAVKLIQKLYVF